MLNAAESECDSEDMGRLLLWIKQLRQFRWVLTKGRYRARAESQPNVRLPSAQESIGDAL